MKTWLDVVNEDWRHQAACRNSNPRLFETADRDTHPHLTHRRREAVNKYTRARASLICGRCPVVTECGDAATAEDREHTVRGHSLRPLLKVGRPRLTLVPVDASLGAAFDLWTSGYTTAEAGRQAGFRDVVLSDLPAWRELARLYYEQAEENCLLMERPSGNTSRGTLPMQRASAVAASPAGHVVLVLRKTVDGRSMRTFLHRKFVVLDVDCDPLERLVMWPNKFDRV